MRKLAFFILTLFSILQSEAQTFPLLPAQLPEAASFVILSSSDKENSLTEESYELYVNDENNELKQLIDSVATGWKTPNLKQLIIKWNISPEATDVEKRDVIDKLVAEISRFQLLKQNSQLQSIYLFVGEGMFIKKGDKLDYISKKGQRENLIRVYNTLSPKINGISFKLDVYADNWGW
jgi:hypothetical protein